MVNGSKMFITDGTYLGDRLRSFMHIAIWVTIFASSGISPSNAKFEEVILNCKWKSGEASHFQGDDDGSKFTTREPAPGDAIITITEESCIVDKGYDAFIGKNAINYLNEVKISEKEINCDGKLNQKRNMNYDNGYTKLKINRNNGMTEFIVKLDQKSNYKGTFIRGSLLQRYQCTVASNKNLF